MSSRPRSSAQRTSWARVQAEPALDPGPVGLDRSDAEDEPLGDLAAGVAQRDQPHDVALARGQAIVLPAPLGSCAPSGRRVGGAGQRARSVAARSRSPARRASARAASRVPRAPRARGPAPGRSAVCCSALGGLQRVRRGPRPRPRARPRRAREHPVSAGDQHPRTHRVEPRGPPPRRHPSKAAAACGKLRNRGSTFDAASWLVSAPTTEHEGAACPKGGGSCSYRKAGSRPWRSSCCSASSGSAS